VLGIAGPESSSRGILLLMKIRIVPIVLFGLLVAAISEAEGRTLTLEEAVQTALDRNERALAAVEDARAAGARVRRARAFLFPDLTLSADYTRRSAEDRDRGEEPGDDGARESNEGRVTVNQTLFRAGGFPLLAQARHLRTAAGHEARDENRQLAYETAAAFLAVLNEQQVARAAEERRSLASRSLHDIELRFEAQLVGSNDVTRTELELASAERELVLAQGNVRIARHQLGQLLGMDAPDSLAIPANLLATASSPDSTGERRLVDLHRALSGRPDVQAARSRVAALRASASEPLTRYLPELGATGSAWSLKETDVAGRREHWRADLGLTWRVFDGGEREAERAERLAMARSAELLLANLERRVAVDIEVAASALERERASLARAEVALTVARRNAEESAELYRQGLVRALEVVDANLQLYLAEVERAGARFSAALALLDLRLASGADPLETGTDPRETEGRP